MTHRISGKEILAASKKAMKSDHCQAAFVKGAKWYKRTLEEMPSAAEIRIDATLAKAEALLATIKQGDK